MRWRFPRLTFVQFSLWIAYCLLLFFFASIKHLLLGSSAWDLGIFEQFSWLIANGNFHEISSLRGIAPLQDHFSILLFPIAIFYKLLPSTCTLLALQSVALGTAPLLTFDILSQRKVSSKIILSLTFAVASTPIIFLANIANFHPETLTVPFMITSLNEVRNRNGVNYYLSLLLTLSAKKSQVLFGVGLSIYSLLKGYKKKSIITFLISCTWWLFASSFTASSGDYIKDRLGYLGGTYSEILLTLVFRPWRIFVEAPPEAIFLYSLGLLLPFAFLLGKSSWFALIASTPIYFTNIISSAGTQRELYSQYSVGILPFLIMACFDSIDSWEEIITSIKNKLFYGTIVISIIAFLGYSRIGYFQTRYFPRLYESLAFHDSKKNIPALASILTTDKYAAHFSNRIFVHTLEDNNFLPIQKYDFIILPTYFIDFRFKNDFAIIKKEIDANQIPCIYPNKFQQICSTRYDLESL